MKVPKLPDFDDQDLRPILDGINDGVAITDLKGRFVFQNAAAERIVGPELCAISPDERPRHYGIYLPDTVTPCPADQMPIARALRGDSVESAEFFLRNAKVPQGMWMSISARPYRDHTGRVCGAVMLFRDVTDMRRAELARQESDRLYRVLFEKNMAGVVHAGIDGAIIECNDAFAHALGYAGREDVLAFRLQQLYFHPEDRDQLIRILEVEGSVTDYEVCFRKRDGSRAWLLSNINLIDPSPGQVGGSIVSIGQDITDRKTWEEALRVSEQRFAAFMRYLPGAAFIKDLAGRYVFFNNGSESLLGMTPEEIVGKTDYEIWPADTASRFRVDDQRVLFTGLPKESIEPVPHPGGLRHWFTYRFPILDQHGAPVFVGGVGLDVTDRTHLEEELRQSQKMEAVGRLAGGVAHDFNNLLTVIGGYGQMALDGLEAGQSAEKFKLYMSEMLNASNRAAALTNQLLAFSRRQVIQPKVLDLNVLLANTERMLRRVIGEHIELTVVMDSAPCMIKVDGSQIEQVILNLAVNARDAMPQGGRLQIITANVDREEAGEANRRRVLLSVEDTGKGMDATTLAHAFEPFFTSKDKGRGTGLGLSTVYGIVKQSGGDITIDSEPGAGSRFSIYWPHSGGGVEVSQPAKATLPVKAGTETVLLVEDEKIVRELVCEMLRRQGYQVFEAEGGQEALRIFEENPDRIDVLLTDVIMPQMSGRALAEELARRQARCKVVYMSGYTDDMIAHQGLVAADVALLLKPFTPDALGRKIREVLER